MITLAIDTSGHMCAAAVHRLSDDTILAEINEDIGRGHAERLMDVITAVLDRASMNYASLTRIAAAAGPGSFTGIRVGLATARGLALGLSIPAIGVNTLEAQWRAANQEDLLVVIDARREEAYCQFFIESGGSNFDPSNLLPTGPFLARYDVLVQMIADIPGDALSICGSGADELNLRLAHRPDKAFTVLHTQAVPPISAIARTGAIMDRESTGPSPLYLRAADAKPQTGFALERL